MLNCSGALSADEKARAEAAAARDNRRVSALLRHIVRQALAAQDSPSKLKHHAGESRPNDHAEPGA